MDSTAQIPPVSFAAPTSTPAGHPQLPDTPTTKPRRPRKAAPKATAGPPSDPKPATQEARGASRRVEYMPLSAITPAPRNPKEHAEEAITASIEEFGLAELPLLDERTGRLVAGHGRYDSVKARHANGDPPPEGITIDPATGDWLMPVIRGWHSKDDAAARAYLIGSNKLTELGGWNDPELAAMLRDLATTDMLAVTGFTPPDLDALLRDSGILSDEAAAPFTTGDGHLDEDGRPLTEGATGLNSPDDGYVAVSWTVQPADRTIIRQALHKARDTFSTETQAGALIALCRHFLAEAQ